MNRVLIRTTLLVYVGYVALLTELASNPATDGSCRGLIFLALALFILGLATSRYFPVFTAYVW